jgi:energy-coupling factor transporter ATP-binding protein EcfA2
MLNFKKGSSLGKISNGRLDGEILYLYDETDDLHLDKRDKVPINYEMLEPVVNKINGKSKYKHDLTNRLYERIQNYGYDDNDDYDYYSSDDETNEYIPDVRKAIKEKENQELILYDGTMQFIPDKSLERFTLYIAGPSGCGKSTFISMFLKEYVKMYPNKKIYLFSRKSQDPALDTIPKIKRIKLDESLYKDPIDIEKDFKNCCLIFDDTDSIMDKKINDAVMRLKDDALQVGRSLKIDVIITSHNVTNYKQSRIILQESQNVVLFIRCVNRQTRYYLENYLGLKKEQIDKMLRLPSRWVVIKQTAPQTVIYQSGAYIL